MFRLILMIVLFLLSLLTVFRAPASLLWYVSILVTEFCWIFFCVVLILMLTSTGAGKYLFATLIIGSAALALFAVPVIGAYAVAADLKNLFPVSGVRGYSDETPAFRLRRMIAGRHAGAVAFTTLTYDQENKLTLDFYPSSIPGAKPCVLVVHGGSWAGGDSRQLPELNSELARRGYTVASINYRLAPQHKYPAPIEDVGRALSYLRSQAAQLGIDTGNFVLLGRSAGGQIVLSAADLLRDPAIKGVISFYGPADMVWGYANPTNPLVLNSRKVMEDYLGGTCQQVPGQYINSSATETATPRSVPVLLIYGKNDPLVSHLHATRLGLKLDRAGVKHYDIYLPWATHGFDWTLNGPGGQLSTWSVMHFLRFVTGKTSIKTSF